MENPSFKFYPSEWKTPNTYDTNFSYPPQKPGVYLIVYPTIGKKNKMEYEMLYAGSSSNLQQRYSSHEVLRRIRSEYDYFQFYFIEHEQYRQIEKRLIKATQPKYNRQWR